MKPVSTGGRPSLMNVPEYRADMCEQVIALGSEGLSECQISARINVPRTTMRSWAGQHPDFSSALTRAKELEQSWWENRGQAALEVKEFNANLWKTSVTARFRKDYGDKITAEHTGPDGVPLPENNSSRDLARAVLDILREAKVESSEG